MFRLAVITLAGAALVLAAITAGPGSASAASGIYRPINYQGKLTTSGGIAIANGNYDMRFRIYGAASGGVPLWSETWNSGTQKVTSTGGLFSIALGTHVAMTGSVNFNSDSLFLQVEFDPGADGVFEEVFSPRRRFASVPYAHNANSLDGLDSTQFIRSDVSYTASGTITISPRDASKVGIDILSTAGTANVAALKLSTQGANHILFGTGASNYDTNLYRAAANSLKTDDSFTAVGTISGTTLVVSGKGSFSGSLMVRRGISGATLEVLGTASGQNLFATQSVSGTHLYAATTFGGAGLADCDTSATSKLLWDSATKRFSCGSDQGGPSVNSGGVLQLGDARYVQKQGDTMTGALVIDIASGDMNTLGLRVLNTISGAVIRAQSALTSSGTLAVEATAVFRGNVGVGTAEPGYKLHLYDPALTAGYMAYFYSENAEVASGQHQYGLGSYAYADPAATSEGITVGISGGAYTKAGNLQNFAGAAELDGLVGSAQHFGLGSMPTLHGVKVHTYNASSGSVAGIYGLRSLFGNFYDGQGNGTTTTAYGVSAELVNNGDNQLDAAYGLNVILDSTSSAAIGTAVGLNINPLSGSITNKYGIYQSGADDVNFFAGLLRLGTASAYLSRPIQMSNTQPGFFMRDSDAGSDEKHWDFFANGPTLTYRLFDDNVSSGVDWLQVTRSGMDVRSVTLPNSPLVVGKSISGAALEVIGTASGLNLFATQSVSGTYLYAASTFGGAGLADCDTAGTSKLLWDDATKQFSCGTDQGGPSVNSGGVLQLGDARYVQKQGDTMTGALVIDIASGDMSTLGLRVLNTISGAVIRAQNTLASSGTLVVKKYAETNTGNILIVDTAGLVYDATNKRVGIGTAEPETNLEVVGIISGALLTQNGAGNNYFMGSVGIGRTNPTTKLHIYGVDPGPGYNTLGLRIESSSSYTTGIWLANNRGIVGSTNATPLDFSTSGVARMSVDTDGNVGIGTAEPETTLEVIGTASGLNLFATQSVSGTYLYAASTFGGAGLADCDTAGTSKLLWDDATKQFSCGTDQTGGSAGTEAFSGAVLNLGDARYVQKQGDTMTGALVIDIASGDMSTLGLRVLNTISGAVIRAQSALTSSGTLVVESTAVFRGSVGVGVENPAARLQVAQTDAADAEAILIDTEESTAAQDVFRIVSDVAGDEDNAFRIQADGTVYSDNAFNSSGADYAEWFFSSTGPLPPGEVVCIDTARPNTVRRCDRDADSNVMGIVSTKPAFVGNVLSGADGLPVPGYVLIGLIGQVPAKVVAEGAASIRPGDSLTPASRPGFARRARAGEATVGVALEGLSSGEGTVNVLISRRNQSLSAQAVEDRVLQTIQALEIDDEVRMRVQDAVNGMDIPEDVARTFREQWSNDDFEQRVRGIVAAYLSGSLMRQPAADAVETMVALQSGTATGALHAAGDLIDGGRLAAAESLGAKDPTLSRGLVHSGDALIGGSLVTGRLRVASGASVDGTLRVAGDLDVLGRLRFTGGLLETNDLLVRGATVLVGGVTVEGLAMFKGDVTVGGALTLSNRQAGYARIGTGHTSVTVRFGSGFGAAPVVNATPASFVETPWRVTATTATGFVIQLKHAVAEEASYLWSAIGVLDPTMQISEPLASEVALRFPVDAQGVPLSTNDAWDACIRNLTLLNSAGTPYSCARYHDSNVWEHPDLHIFFTYDGGLTPPLLILPAPYVPWASDGAWQLPIVGGDEVPDSVPGLPATEPAGQESAGPSPGETSQVDAGDGGPDELPLPEEPSSATDSPATAVSADGFDEGDLAASAENAEQPGQDTSAALPAAMPDVPASMSLHETVLPAGGVATDPIQSTP